MHGSYSSAKAVSRMLAKKLIWRSQEDDLNRMLYFHILMYVIRASPDANLAHELVAAKIRCIVWPEEGESHRILL